MPPVYIGATAPKMQALAGRDRRRLPDAVDHHAGIRPLHPQNVGEDVDIGCTVVASIDESDRRAGRDGAREIAGMYLANKVQNIKGAADTLLELAGLTQDELARSRRRWNAGAASAPRSR